MAKEDSLAAERLWMYITIIDEDRDTAHTNITKIKYISAQQPIKSTVTNIYVSISRNVIYGFENNKVLANLVSTDIKFLLAAKISIKNSIFNYHIIPSCRVYITF